MHPKVLQSIFFGKEIFNIDNMTTRIPDISLQEIECAASIFVENLSRESFSLLEEFLTLKIKNLSHGEFERLKWVFKRLSDSQTMKMVDTALGDMKSQLRLPLAYQVWK
jgi:hypothetical protein